MSLKRKRNQQSGQRFIINKSIKKWHAWLYNEIDHIGFDFPALLKRIENSVHPDLNYLKAFVINSAIADGPTLYLDPFSNGFGNERYVMDRFSNIFARSEYNDELVERMQEEYPVEWESLDIYELADAYPRDPADLFIDGHTSRIKPAKRQLQSQQKQSKRRKSQRQRSQGSQRQRQRSQGSQRQKQRQTRGQKQQLNQYQYQYQ